MSYHVLNRIEYETKCVRAACIAFRPMLVSFLVTVKKRMSLSVSRQSYVFSFLYILLYANNFHQYPYCDTYAHTHTHTYIYIYINVTFPHQRWFWIWYFKLTCFLFLAVQCCSYQMRVIKMTLVVYSPTNLKSSNPTIIMMCVCQRGLVDGLVHLFTNMTFSTPFFPEKTYILLLHHIPFQHTNTMAKICLHEWQVLTVFRIEWLASLRFCYHWTRVDDKSSQTTMTQWIVLSNSVWNPLNNIGTDWELHI